MGVLGNSNQQRSSGGVLGREKRELEEQSRQRITTGQQIGLFNPIDQQQATRERFSPTPASGPIDMRPVSSPTPPTTNLLPRTLEDVAAKRNAGAPRSPLPTLQDVLEKPTRKVDTRTLTERWVDDRLEKDREQASKTPVFKVINKALEPVSRYLYEFTAEAPGVAAFQRGAAEGLGVQSFAPPERGPDWVNNVAGFAGTIAGSAAGMQGTGIRPVADPLAIGSAAAQGAARTAPVLGRPVAQRAIEGVVGGAVGGALDSAIRGQTDAKDIAIGAGAGAALGGIGDVAIGAIGDVARGALSRRAGQVDLPTPATTPDVDLPTVSRTMDSLETSMPSAQAVASDVQVPRAPDLPAADAALGITPQGKAGKYAETDTRSHIATKTTRDRIDVGKLADDFYTNNVNNLQWIDEFDKQVQKATGRKLDADERAYLLAQNSRGADMTSRHILTERLVDPQGRVIGKSLKDITSQIPSNKAVYDSFTDYLIARHAPTRMNRGEKVYSRKQNMTAEKAEALAREYEQRYPEFATIANDLDQWNDTIGRAWLVDTGIVPEAMYKKWREDNPFWVPNKRFFTDLEKRQQAKGARRGFGNQNNPVKAYNKEGSERQIIDPFESLIEYTDKYVKTARRNEVMQTIYRQLEQHPDELDGFATILKREKLDEKTMGADGVAGLIDQLDDEFDQAFLRKSDLDKDNVISTLINGERVYMRVDNPDFLDALVNVTPITRHAIVEGARKVTNAMKMLTTGVNPIFGLTRNIFRDIPEAYIYSKTTDNPFRYAWDTLESFISVFADGASDAVRDSRLLQRMTPESFRNFLDRQARLYKDYKALGGGHSSPAAANRNLLAQSKRDLLPQQRSGPVAFGQRAWAALESLNNALESGPRLGEFKRSRQAGGDTYGSRQQGIFEAQDLTTNFKRHGQIVREADAFIPYLNAAVQGLDKFIRSFKDRPVAVTGKALAMIAAPTIALYALNHNNPNYQKLNNYTKDNFYLIPTTDGTFIKIPKPRELGVPFGGLLERTMRAWADDDPEAFRDFADTAATMFTPPGIPVKEVVEGDPMGALIKPVRDMVIGPVIDVARNENFAGSPIVPGYLEGASPRNQYDANTSEVAKKVGNLINMSPKQIDHLIRSYTGVLGQIGLPATTQGASVGDTLKRQVTADPVFSTDASRNFYDLKADLDRMYADIKITGELPDGYNDDARKYINQVAGQMSDYTKAIRAVDGMDELSDEQKKETKRQLTDQRNNMAREAYELVRDILKGSG